MGIECETYLGWSERIVVRFLIWLGGGDPYLKWDWQLEDERRGKRPLRR